MEKQETIARHSGRTKRQADKVSACHVREHAHGKTTPAAPGVGLKRGVRRRITHAVRKDSAPDARSAGRPDLEQRFERGQAILTTYFTVLEGGGHALPGNPKAPDEVFFPQVEAESGLPLNSLTIQQSGEGGVHVARLRGVIEGAAKRLGVELRVLPRSPGSAPAPLTYAQLLERGTDTRRRELQGKASQRQQLYNTRSALSQFVERSGLDKATAVGDEFAAGFDGAITEVAATFGSEGTLKKFMTEIEWWREFHRGLLKGQAMPADFRGALAHLTYGSGLSLRMVARLSCMSATSLEEWRKGARTPAASSYAAVTRIERLFKLPAGTLVNKLSSRGHGGRFRRARLPEFMREDPQLAHRVTPHLPDDFCELPLERQREVVESVRVEVIRGNDPHTLMVMELSKLPYRLTDWPPSLADEFEDLAAFKTGERPPLGMDREGRWRATTAEKVRHDLAHIFGAFSLPGDAGDVRVRGLGVPAAHVTMAMFACPTLLDWFLRFMAERSGRYTGAAKTHLDTIRSLVRPGTGWLWQRPALASRLRPISCGLTEFMPTDFVARSQTDWRGLCGDAYRGYKKIAKDLEDLITVGRDPFLPIDGIVGMDSPMRGLQVLLDGMRDCLPNKQTQPAAYHVVIRDRALVTLLAVTGLRRTTLSLLDYGGPSGHLSGQNGSYELNIPRPLFKVEHSPFFGPKQARKDYFMKLPEVFGLNELLDEYLNVSRPWLLDRFHGRAGAGEHPLFVTARAGNSVRVGPETVAEIYKRAATRHLVENRWRGTGIPGVRLHGPHSVRHIRGTEAVKRTHSFQVAGDANHNSEEAARKHYSRYLPADRNERVNGALFESKEVPFKSNKDEEEGEGENEKDE